MNNVSSELTKLSTTCYYDSYGYYIYNDNIWVFLPKEKYYDTNDLLNISNILNIFNETTNEFLN